jgi:hypothetical protein
MKSRDDITVICELLHTLSSVCRDGLRAKRIQHLDHTPCSKSRRDRVDRVANLASKDSNSVKCPNGVVDAITGIRDIYHAIVRYRRCVRYGKDGASASFNSSNSLHGTKRYSWQRRTARHLGDSSAGYICSLRPSDVLPCS